VEIQQVHGALRGVTVEAGTHRIRMGYGPRSALVGGAMSAAGLVAALLIWWFERRRVSGRGSLKVPL